MRIPINLLSLLRALDPGRSQGRSIAREKSRKQPQKSENIGPKTCSRCRSNFVAQVPFWYVAYIYHEKPSLQKRFPSHPFSRFVARTSRITRVFGSQQRARQRIPSSNSQKTYSEQTEEEYDIVPADYPTFLSATPKDLKNP